MTVIIIAGYLRSSGPDTASPRLSPWSSAENSPNFSANDRPSRRARRIRLNRSMRRRRASRVKVFAAGTAKRSRKRPHTGRLVKPDAKRRRASLKSVPERSMHRPAAQSFWSSPGAFFGLAFCAGARAGVFSVARMARPAACALRAARRREFRAALLRRGNRYGV
jgi:hypothetical protein